MARIDQRVYDWLSDNSPATSEEIANSTTMKRNSVAATLTLMTGVAVCIKGFKRNNSGHRVSIYAAIPNARPAKQCKLTRGDTMLSKTYLHLRNYGKSTSTEIAETLNVRSSIVSNGLAVLVKSGHAIRIGRRGSYLFSLKTCSKGRYAPTEKLSKPDMPTLRQQKGNPFALMRVSL